MDSKQQNEEFNHLNSRKNNVLSTNFNTKLKTQPISEIDYDMLKDRDSYFHWKVVRNVYTAIVLLFIFSLVYHFSKDANNRINAEIRQKSIQFTLCRTEYLENECEKPKPALRQFCLEKENCMASNPENEVTKINHILLMFVEIFNMAVHKSDWKALVFFIVILSVAVILSILANIFDRKRKIN